MMKLGESVGIEIEVEEISPRFFNGRFRDERQEIFFSTTSDASCETERFEFNNLPVYNLSGLEIPNIQLNRNVFGAEFVSSIIDTERDYLPALKYITKQLFSLGESPKGYRAGFHVHVNTPSNLRILKSILRLGRNLEQVFFLLGGMGYDFRGKKNDSIYCRPITKKGPLCVQTGFGRFVQVFNISDLLATTTTDEFLLKYGNLNALNGHYLPVRYHWLNLVNLFGRGSLEFRVFNKTLNPTYIYAVVEFCKAFSQYAIQSSFSSLKDDGLLKENSVFDVREDSRDYIIKTFLKFAERSTMKQDVVDIILDILSLSDINSIILPDQYTFCHLQFHARGNRSPVHWQNGGYNPPKIDTSAIKIPEFEDLHVSRGRQENNNPIETLYSIPQQDRRESLRGFRYDPRYDNPISVPAPEEESEEEYYEEEYDDDYEEE